MRGDSADLSAGREGYLYRVGTWRMRAKYVPWAQDDFLYITANSY